MGRRKKIRRVLLKEGVEYLDNKLQQIHIGSNALSINSGCCYAVCQMVHNILKKLHIETRIVRVSYLIATNGAWEILMNNMEKGVDPLKTRQEIVDKNEWSIGLGYENKSDSFHFVLMTNDNEIIDLTIGQASRPEHNLIFSPFWCKEEDVPADIRQIQMKDTDEAIDVASMGVLQIEGKTYLKNIEMGLHWHMKKILRIR